MSRSSQDPGGGFARSTGTAAVRGFALIAVAVVVGFVLLSSGLDDDGTPVSANDTTTTTTTAADGEDATGSTTPTTSATPKPANEVRVLVANGSGVQGAATTLNDQLKAKGYIGLDPKNAAGNVPATIVYFTEGFQREAAAVATAIGADATTVQALPNPPPLEDPAGFQDAHVLIVLGPDLARPSG